MSGPFSVGPPNGGDEPTPRGDNDPNVGSPTFGGRAGRPSDPNSDDPTLEQTPTKDVRDGPFSTSSTEKRSRRAKSSRGADQFGGPGHYETGDAFDGSSGMSKGGFGPIGSKSWIMPTIVAVVVGFVVIGIVVSLLLARRGPTGQTSEEIVNLPAPNSSTTPDTSTPGSQTEMVTETCRTTEGVLTRECTVVIPPDSSGENLPVVILLHGLATPGWQMRSFGGWNQAQQDRDFIVVTPEGTFQSWNAGPCCIPASATGVDDLSYLNGLVSRIAERPDVDPDRIFMVGGSNGGMMTWRVLCENDGSIAKAVSYAGTAMSQCEPKTPISMLQIHGTDDQVVPYAGGSSLAGALVGGVTFPGVKTAVESRAADLGCEESSEEEIASEATQETYKGCDAGTEISLITLNGEGHDWPPKARFGVTDLILDYLDI